MAKREKFAVPELVDIHCHLLPGVDDGSKDWDKTLQMLQVAYEDGIRKVIATPHFGCHGFMADKQKRTALVAEANARICDRYPDMRVFEGCEIYAFTSGIEENIYHGKSGTLADSRYVLLELSMKSTAQEILKRARELANVGLKPIVAHVERYESIRHIEQVEELASVAYIQVNAGSIMGDLGFTVKRFARRLLAHELVSFVATDAHGVNHRPPRLRECYQTVCMLCGEEYAARLFCDNPNSIIENKIIV